MKNKTPYFHELSVEKQTELLEGINKIINTICQKEELEDADMVKEFKEELSKYWIQKSDEVTITPDLEDHEIYQEHIEELYWGFELNVKSLIKDLSWRTILYQQENEYSYEGQEDRYKNYPNP